MKFKPLPIGIENFEDMITRDYYYIDKTLFIKELIDNMWGVNLFTRPRRFGKSLNMSMLQYFFEIGRDSKTLFQNLKISSASEKYTSHMNLYPVINLTLKSAKMNTFEDSVKRLTQEIQDEYNRHSYLIESSKITDSNKKILMGYMQREISVMDYTRSLKFLSACLKQHHNQKVIILIDEYDVPLDNAYFNGFYDEMIHFMRPLFGDALKTNSSLHFAVITGCLRISKESIFTGLNNLRVISILSKHYSEYYGFTEKEIEEALSYYHLESKTEEVKKWYNGYYFGETNVYNPWSVMHYLADTAYDHSNHPISYWANTSSNDIIRTLIEKAG
ncbi:MAG: AAA family ATPase, partial [Lachnoclostridium sp.]|nr:AAA family ATPase [Lachnoclostridium sp.]